MRRFLGPRLWIGLTLCSMAGGSLAQTPQENYCMQPAFVQTNLQPNIMILMDNSGSMFFFAYNYNGSGVSTGFDPTKRYYGYFSPDYWYTYDGNDFSTAALKTAARPASSWDGSFLNWLTMRRVDVVREVLVGGKQTCRSGGACTNKKEGEQADGNSRGYKKQVTNADLYTPYSGTRCFKFNTGSATASQFQVDTTSPFDDCSFSSAPSFNVRIVPTAGVEKTTGVYQELDPNARFGLEVYANDNVGGNLIEECTANNSTNMVTNLENTRPGTATPLAESLWTATGYFRQYSPVDSTSGPRYHNGGGSYQPQNSSDPYNFNPSGQPLYVPCVKSFVLVVTDGEPTLDRSLPASVKGYNATYSGPSTALPSFPGDDSDPLGDFDGGNPPNYFWFSPNDGSHYIDDVALWAHVDLTGAGSPKRRDLRSGAVGEGVALGDDQYLTIYMVAAAFDGLSPDGRVLLERAARNGGFDDSNGNFLPDVTTEFDKDGDGFPDTYFEASDGQELEDKIRAALLDILKRAASSTSATVLASGEGQGANLLQAFFFPRKQFGTAELDWSGFLQNEWFYVDPFLALSSIREDTLQDLELNLSQDYIVEFFFDNADQQTKARLFADANGDGAKDTPGTPTATIPIENVKSLWEAGIKLFVRDPDDATDPRVIKTTISKTSPYTFVNFTTANKAQFYVGGGRNYLQATSDQDALDIITYARGNDVAGKRNRTTTIDVPGIGLTTNTWKLGDIVTSTAKIEGPVPLNAYQDIYNDTTYSAYINSNSYKSRGMVFAGANDGMMHAFKLGLMEFDWVGKAGSDKARITGTDLGKEMWAYIPRNSLPYLRYLMETNYCHLYFVDGTPMVFDASIGGGSPPDQVVRAIDGSTWRTILIGSMRLGGACGTSEAGNWVHTPATALDQDGARVGRSSYFALDVTDPETPVLLWEFADPSLGYSTTNAAIVRMISRDGSNQKQPSWNGKWFFVIGSGPTGDVDTTAHQFMGKSDQNLRIFILDLATGSLVRTIDAGAAPLNLTNSFSGNLLNSTVDVEKDYEDDILYIGYTKKTGSTWTDGGVLRLVTKGDANPANWALSTVMSGIGPVTASITNLQDTIGHNMWIFGGTGRYYFKDSTGNYDDPDSQRHIFGVKEPCYLSDDTIDPTCTTSLNFGTDLTDVTAAGVPSGVATGWKIRLDLTSGQDKAERMLTNPLATFTGAVLFTTTKPSGDLCSSGGKTFLWAINYNTGNSGAGSLYGLGLVQTSTGAIEQKGIPSSFTDKVSTNETVVLQEGSPDIMIGRRTGEIIGLSTAVSPPPMLMPKPYKRIISVLER